MARRGGSAKCKLQRLTKKGSGQDGVKPPLECQLFLGRGKSESSALHAIFMQTLFN